MGIATPFGARRPFPSFSSVRRARTPRPTSGYCFRELVPGIRVRSVFCGLDPWVLSVSVNDATSRRASETVAANRGEGRESSNAAHEVCRYR